ncbi:MAG TPA: CDP-diacylglycerol--glycerol-3-phosphate 3-phosphatidyltransferase [Planctomycetes bacterium]|nr:CDP-diacylglycerol--glycerol-3-phosphate 3-phosphatidyltransferase [Planctomycetota bacterium]
MGVAAKDRRDGIFKYWPNRITAMRFAGSLLLFLLLALFGEIEGPGPSAVVQAAFWLFLLIAASDFLDGYLARRGNHVTAFGRIADPFVDKVMVIGTMVFLAVLPWSREWFPAWVVVVVVAREFLVTGIRGYIESLGLEFPADWFGKVKMIVQCIAIGIVLGLFSFPWPDVLRGPLEFLGHLFVWVTVVATLGSGISYVRRTARILGADRGGE